MDVIDALNARHSVRAFQPASIDDGTLKMILRNALRAPSWADTQPWEIYVAGGPVLERIRQGFLDSFDNQLPAVPDIKAPTEWPIAMQDRMQALGKERFKTLGITREDTEARRQLARRNYSLFGAPAVVYLAMDRTLTPWSMLDLGSFAQSLMLAAKDAGVDSIIAFSLVAYPDIIRAEMDIPDDQQIVVGIALGYKDDGDALADFRSERRSFDEAVRMKGF